MRRSFVAASVMNRPEADILEAILGDDGRQIVAFLLGLADKGLGFKASNFSLEPPTNSSAAISLTYVDGSFGKLRFDSTTVMLTTNKDVAPGAVLGRYENTWTRGENLDLVREVKQEIGSSAISAHGPAARLVAQLQLGTYIA
jgi:hypothetical protein